MSRPDVTSALSPFHPCTQDWFAQAFSAPTQVQTEAWPGICDGRSALLLAPTGSGKTLAAFLAAIDRLFFKTPHHEAVETTDDSRRGVRVLYISPLKALGVDVDRNLKTPISGLQEYAQQNNIPHHVPTVAIRSGDTSQAERAKILRSPPDILITTPESLYLMLTSKAEAVLNSVETVIVDEIHALAGTKRGSHLFSTLERLERLRRWCQRQPGRIADTQDVAPLQRIGLSATQRPLEEIATLLGGAEATADADVPVTPRRVEIIDASQKRRFELAIEMPSEESSESTADSAKGGTSSGADVTVPEVASSWPSIHPRLVELVRQHRSTMIFVNSRGLAERLAGAINELAEEEIALAHHGSVAKDTRAVIESRLKNGDLPAIVATSSLELGIDMGAVDLVIQIEAPPSIASGTQRIGRAGHQVGAVSSGVIFPKYRADLLACSAAAGAMLNGWVEETHYPRNPLDVLAQQIVAITSREAISVDELFAMLRGAAPFFDLPRSSFENVLDLLSGRFPSDAFSELRPRLNWDRISGTISPRKGARLLAILNGGTIPDRGLYGVYLVGGDGQSGGRVGELDEEMVFESKPGDVFLLGASSWRVIDITRDRVLVVPAPGVPGRLPFWHGEGPGRPFEFGQAIGRLSRELTSLASEDAVNQLQTNHSLDRNAAESLLGYLQLQIDATGELPTDVSIVFEVFPDEVGDWRIVLLSPFGTRVHAPWAMIVAARLRIELDTEVDVMWTDDGIAFRIPGSLEIPPAELFLPDPNDVEDELVREVGGTALFAARFRENAGRSLLLPRRNPKNRTPLWLQRRKSADLLKVVSEFRSFPILLETYRECLSDVFDLTALRQLLEDVQAKAVRVTWVTHNQPSPFAGNILFSYVGNFIYDLDAPLAERRAQTLALDQNQLRELLGKVDLRTLLDPNVIAEVTRERQQLTSPCVRHADDLHGLLLNRGPLSKPEIRLRCDDTEHDAVDEWIEELLGTPRIFSVEMPSAEFVAGTQRRDDREAVDEESGVRYAAAEDAGRLRDALGVVPDKKLPAVFLQPVPNALQDLISRYARCNGPFTVNEAAAAFGLGVDPVQAVLVELARIGRVVDGEFRPAGTGQEWCHVDVLRILKRRSLMALRKEVQPVETSALVRFLPEWHGVTRPRRGLDGLLDIVEQLQGAPLPASTLEEEILPSRMTEFRSADLDELCVQGEVIWRGIDSTGTTDGRIALFLADQYSLLAPLVKPIDDPAANDIRRLLERRNAMFFDQIVADLHEFPNDLLKVLWQMVWNGELTNDTLTPLRSLRQASVKSAGNRKRSSSRRFRSRRTGRLPGSEGRWSLLPTLRADADGVEPAPPTITERQFAIAAQLIERHGVVTKEMLTREEVSGGFSGLYPVFKAMEESGRVRRGYFIHDLGVAQFASPGADDRLRAFRSPTENVKPIVLAATDPACPWGNAIPWPPTPDSVRPQRAAGAEAIVLDGQLIGYLAKTGEQLTTFLPKDGARRNSAITHLADALSGMARPGKSLLLKKIDGGLPDTSVVFDALLAVGFSATSNGLLHTGRILES